MSSFLMTFFYAACMYWSILGVLLATGVGLNAPISRGGYIDELRSTRTRRVSATASDASDTGGSSSDDLSDTGMGVIESQRNGQDTTATATITHRAVSHSF